MRRLLVTGASGVGSTTLARVLAARWHVPHADADDYFWLPTDPPFQRKRPEPDRVALMRQVFLPRAAWVLSGSVLGWGDDLVPLFDGVVFLTLDPTVRLRRLTSREAVRQAGSGGVTATAAQEFLAWARGYDDPTFPGRNRARHDQWLAGLPCPVLQLDSAVPVADLADQVAAWLAGTGSTAALPTRR